MGKSSPFFSSAEDLERIRDIVSAFARLPFSELSIPGAVMEAVLANVRSAEVLHTYDFVDVVDRTSGFGYQVKSTLLGTPVTWKRVKLPMQSQLIAASHKTAAGLHDLGNSIIAFCNTHAQQSLIKYNLKKIGFARLYISKTGMATYYERELCSAQRPGIFDAGDFDWRWSVQKNTKKKEQLPALHGIHRADGTKWFAWHGADGGENQLHFSGEKKWWPEADGKNSISFQLPSATDRLSIETFVSLLARLADAE